MELRRPAAILLILLGATLFLTLVITQTIALTPAMKETPLNDTGQVHEMFRDVQGNLWISDYLADEIWQVDPLTNAYTVYENLIGASDGRLDGSGNLWWSNFADGALGRLDPSLEANEIQGTLWPLPEGSSPLGIAFDDSGQVWVTDVFEPDLYRFDPTSKQLCRYTVPDAGAADYILFHDGLIWLGDTILGRILSLNPSSGMYTIWQLPLDSYPQGMAFDGKGQLWWADPELGVLGRLIPQSNQMTTFAVPTFGEETAQPQGVAIKNGELWYTDWSGSVGLLDPALAGGSPATISPTTSSSSPTCSTVISGTIAVTKRTGSLTWSDANYNLAQNKDGWLIYALPSGGAPWGVAASGTDVWFNDQGTWGIRAQQLGWLHFSEPAANFNGDPVEGVAPLTVTFTNATSNTYTTSLWDFGDGQISAEQHPTHVYTATGTYTVSLEVSGPGGSDGLTRTNYITGTEPAPVADFSGDLTKGFAPLDVQFSDESTSAIDTWLWEFGDGDNSAEQHPTHVYTAPGTYTVSLEVSGPGGNDSLTRTNYITVTDPTPVADFSGDPTEGFAPLEVQFSDKSTGAIDTWMWEFGDWNSSAEQHPAHVFTSTGVYTLSLTVSGLDGSDTLTRTNYITVTDPVPVADFSGNPTRGVAPLAVQLSDESTGAIDTWLWKFGDGDKSAEQHPAHVFTSTGVYTLSLTVSGLDGSDILTRTNYITVTEPAPVADFSGKPTRGVAPLAVQLSDESTGAIDTWLWKFGDGDKSTEQHPAHVFTSTGVYTVSLTVGGLDGSDTLTRTNYITVTAPAPVANFFGEPTRGVAPLAVQFNDESTGAIDTWLWEFGDGDNSAEQHPAHVFTSTGVYTVSLTVGGLDGSDTLTRTNYITVTAPAPVANFFGEPTRGVAPLAVQFNDESTGAIDTWLWEFGDGDNSAEQHPAHVFTSTGVYTVSLAVGRLDGSDTLTRTNYITVTEPEPAIYGIYLPIVRRR